MILENNLLEVRNLKLYFNEGKSDEVKAVDDISFSIPIGKTLGLVGESGCGKSTTGRALLRLYDGVKGDIIYKGENILNKDSKSILAMRSKMQMIFQDPYASLNPRMNVADVVAEGIDIHNIAKNEKERIEKVYQALEKVGLNTEHASRFPHEFSGGQRQRIGIARALAVNPEFIVADEPISALDVSIQAQIINLLKSLQEEYKLTYLFIAHDLSMVRYISDRIGVMYFGKIVEIGNSNSICSNPMHPYTKALLSAIPIANPILERQRKRIHYDPSMHNYSSDNPKLREVSEDHFVYCSNAEFGQLKQTL